MDTAQNCRKQPDDNNVKKKPEVIQNYKKNKTKGVDTMDQMVWIYSCKRNMEVTHGALVQCVATLNAYTNVV